MRARAWRFGALALLLVVESAMAERFVSYAPVSLPLRGGKDPCAGNSVMECHQGSADNASSTEAYQAFPVLRAELNECLNVESLCMACEQQGKTNILPIEIPHFGRVVVMAFECDECGYRSNEVKEASEIRPLGARYLLHVQKQEDLSRQVKLKQGSERGGIGGRRNIS